MHRQVVPPGSLAANIAARSGALGDSVCGIAHPPGRAWLSPPAPRRWPVFDHRLAQLAAGALRRAGHLEDAVRPVIQDPAVAAAEVAAREPALGERERAVHAAVLQGHECAFLAAGAYDGALEDARRRQVAAEIPRQAGDVPVLVQQRQPDVRLLVAQRAATLMSDPPRRSCRLALSGMVNLYRLV